MATHTACPIATRRERLTGAVAYLKRRCILVDVVDRDAMIRTYRVTGKRLPKLAEEVIEIAELHGFEAGHG